MQFSKVLSHMSRIIGISVAALSLSAGAASAQFITPVIAFTGKGQTVYTETQTYVGGEICSANEVKSNAQASLSLVPRSAEELEYYSTILGVPVDGFWTLSVSGGECTGYNTCSTDLGGPYCNDHLGIAFSSGTQLLGYYAFTDFEAEPVFRATADVPIKDAEALAITLDWKLHLTDPDNFNFELLATHNGTFTLSRPKVTAVLVDPIRALLDGAAVTTDHTRLATQGQVVHSVAADGAARVVLRIPADVAGEQLTLALLNDQDDISSSREEDGALASLDNQSGELVALTVTAVDTPAGPMAFALYHAPQNFARQRVGDIHAAKRTVTIEITVGEGNLSRAPITIVRPPLIMVHGLWSNDETWEAFGDRLLADIPGLRIFKANYKDSNASHFSLNRNVVRAEISSRVKELRAEGIAVVRADVFGHSMGGLLSRLWAGDAQYYRDLNYGMGDINKLVTINSPHLGSYLADALPVFEAWLDLHPFYLYSAENLRIALRNYDHAIDLGAVEDLATYSPAIKDLNARPTQIPSHAIIGDFQIPGADLTILSEPLGSFFKILTFFGFDTTDFLISTHSDIIVTVTSQAGELEPAASTTFDYNHFGILNGIDVHQRGLELLNTAPNDPVFHPGFPTQ